MIKIAQHLTARSVRVIRDFCHIISSVCSYYRVIDLRKAIVQLMKIAQHLKARRVRGGALELESVEVQIQLSETKSIENLNPKDVRFKVYSLILVLELLLYEEHSNLELNLDSQHYGADQPALM